MGWWPFGRKPVEDTSVETLLAQANAASPTGGFGLTVGDVFSIAGRGTVVTGRVESGVVTVGQQVELVREGATIATTTVTGIEKFRAVLETAQAGDSVGLLLKDLSRDQVHGGDRIQTPPPA
jgi:elongation factor Tu